MRLPQGRFRCGIRKRILTRGLLGTDTGSPGKPSRHQVAEGQVFGQHSQAYGLIVGSPVWSWDYLVTLVGPFQLGLFHDSVTL